MFHVARTAQVRLHMAQLREAACGVLVVSWYPPGMADGQVC
jgi:hypothetical protein